MKRFSCVSGKCFVILLAVLFALTACGKSEDKQDAPAAGGEFNKFFPKSQDGFDVVFTQEKAGMAQAKLKKDGKDAAMLTIADLKGNPDAAGKFKNSTASISGYPAAASGGLGTAVLVADRFQVQARSNDGSFTENDRRLWLERFNLSGLAQLK
ncbi:MAG: hypothetical protein AB7S75_09485 [Desulfococcaceae bacterium]